MKSIQIKETGDSSKLVLVNQNIPSYSEEEVLVRVKSAGVNFIDIYFRKGIYPVNLPYTPGMEASGLVEKVGSKVIDFKVGERVVYTGVMGGYSEFAVVPASKLVKLPNGLSFNEASCLMLQGMTAHYLAYDISSLKKGDFALVHSAAGGVGLLLIQMLKLQGVKVIGTVSTKDKETLAKNYGADFIINYKESDFEIEVRKICPIGVKIVFDSVGKTTFDKSINCLSRRGYMVLFGSSSGPVPLFDISILNKKGSLFLTRPSLNDYTSTRDELIQKSSTVFNLFLEKKIRLQPFKEYSLEDGAKAHDDLENRRTTGKLLLIP